MFPPMHCLAPPQVPSQPEVEVSVWRILRHKCGKQYIVTLMPGQTVRVSSPIRTLDMYNRLAVTQSGRTYRFLAKPTPVQTFDSFSYDVMQELLTDATDISELLWAPVRESDRRLAAQVATAA